jgi:hypothetical protein
MKPWYGYRYALIVDQCPRDDTREAACKSPEWAYLYITEVDKEVRNITWEAIKNTEYEKRYRKRFNDPIKDLII